jgi:hypothetical protein
MKTVTLTRAEALGLTLPDLADVEDKRVRLLRSLATAQKINAVKEYRALTQRSLRESIDFVDNLCRPGIPMDDWFARAAVVRWLTEGERCPEERCDKGTVYRQSDDWFPCHTCNGSGYIRKPSPAFHLLDVASPIEAAWSAATLWASVLRVRAGLFPIFGTAPASSDRGFDEHRATVANYAILNGTGDEATITLNIPENAA